MCGSVTTIEEINIRLGVAEILNRQGWLLWWTGFPPNASPFSFLQIRENVYSFFE
jgi:hypothetical protein